MFNNFFQIVPAPIDQMIGHYDLRLVVLSYLVAVFASYIALDMTGRLRDPGNTTSSTLFWLIGGSIAMGAGIWTMHFVGMLSFSVPMMTMHYEIFWTALSLLVAIVASSFALYLLKTKVINVMHLAIGGIILGLAIASMHYLGMEAMKMNMEIHYLPGIFSLSILIAIAASEAALWLALKSNQVKLKYRSRLKIISAAIMGLAICGMHYTGMASAIFTQKISAIMNHTALDPTILSISITTMTFVILGTAFFASIYKQKMEAARQLGMAEVAESVIHNVGNVLNSINVSANLVLEKISKSKLDFLEDLRILINEHKHDLGDFITKNPQGEKLPNYINLLAEQWRNEKSTITNELNTLNKYLEHIKVVVSMQQGLSKTKDMHHIMSISEVLEEALLITGLTNGAKGIKVEKNYESLSPIVIDRIKAIQALVNILNNAKDALMESSKENKLLTIKYYLHNHDQFVIQITDNGIGILRENINKIYTYGFTTKQSGHGFGMHSCALAINQMGGVISVTSEGLEKGATFTIKLPYNLPKK